MGWKLHSLPEEDLLETANQAFNHACCFVPLRCCFCARLSRVRVSACLVCVRVVCACSVCVFVTTVNVKYTEMGAAIFPVLNLPTHVGLLVILQNEYILSHHCAQELQDSAELCEISATIGSHLICSFSQRVQCVSKSDFGRLQQLKSRSRNMLCSQFF